MRSYWGIISTGAPCSQRVGEVNRHGRSVVSPHHVDSDLSAGKALRISSSRKCVPRERSARPGTPVQSDSKRITCVDNVTASSKRTLARRSDRGSRGYQHPAARHCMWMTVMPGEILVIKRDGVNV